MEGFYSNYPTISKSIAEFLDKSKKDQEAVDETTAHIPSKVYWPVYGTESIDHGPTRRGVT